MAAWVRTAASAEAYASSVRDIGDVLGDDVVDGEREAVGAGRAPTPCGLSARASFWALLSRASTRFQGGGRPEQQQPAHPEPVLGLGLGRRGSTRRATESPSSTRAG